MLDAYSKHFTRRRIFSSRTHVLAASLWRRRANGYVPIFAFTYNSFMYTTATIRTDIPRCIDARNRNNKKYIRVRKQGCSAHIYIYDSRLAHRASRGIFTLVNAPQLGRESFRLVLTRASARYIYRLVIYSSFFPVSIFASVERARCALHDDSHGGIELNMGTGKLAKYIRSAETGRLEGSGSHVKCEWNGL